MSCFVIAGGGTGGHVLPALAVARELRDRGHQVQFIGVPSGLEARLVPAESFPIEWIDIGGLNRVGISKTVTNLIKLPLSVLRSARLLKHFRPAAVFSTGGYVAGPVLLAAILLSIPTVVMEPNAVPGFTHRKLARWVTRALVSFEETAHWFPSGCAEVTGLPVRSEFFSIVPKPLGQTATVLITGGSQGSQKLNLAARESWPLWQRGASKGGVRLLLQTGKRMHSELAAGFAQTGLPGEVREFWQNMADAFREADIVVARSGMGTVSELAAAGKPAILVPFPAAADDHQLKNAQAFERAGASLLVLDSALDGPRLVKEVERLIADPGMLARMSVAARAFAHPQATRRAAEVLEAAARERQGKSAD